jgi:hypothetical protein
MVLEAKEHPAIPLGAGDLMGDRRQGFIGPPQILEVVGAHCYAVFDTLPLAEFLEESRSDDPYLRTPLSASVE